VTRMKPMAAREVLLRNGDAYLRWHHVVTGMLSKSPDRAGLHGVIRRVAAE
jgi:hypothetical protein